ncbi:MAG: hypothetical protein Q8908_08960 [Bacteroidota bacterium]|nr:hypothetical protein [Bacteroidota bacterium]
MKHFLALIFLLVFLPLERIIAQSDRPLRVELEVKSGEEPFRLVPCGENGLILFAQTNKNENKDNVLWAFNFYDKNLKALGQVLYPVPRNYDFLDYETDNNSLYMVFNSTRSSSGNECMLLYIDPVKYIIASIPFKVPEKTNICSFKILNNNAYVSLVSKNNKFYVVKVNMNDGTNSVIVEEKSDNPSVMSMLLEPSRNLLSLFIQKEEKRSVFNFSTYTYDLSGARIEQKNYTGFNKNNFLVTAELFRNKSGELLVLGSFNDEPEHRYADYFSNGTETSGFVSGLLTSGDAKINYLRFSEITNYHGYFNEKNTLLNLNAKGKARKLSEINYTTVAQNIHQIDNSYYSVLETYVPEYHRNYRQVYNFYSNFPSTYSDYPILDGYRFISAMTVSFSDKGAINWSSAMEIRDVFSKYIYPRMNLLFDGDDAVLSYSTKGKILSKVVNSPDSQTGYDQMSILPDKPRDEIMDDYNNSLSFWYGNYFIAYGYQQIRNNYISENKRTVFYVNKLAFR